MGSCCNKGTQKTDDYQWIIGRKLIRKGDSDVYDHNACYEDDLPKPYQISTKDIYNDDPKFIIILDKKDEIKNIYYG